MVIPNKRDVFSKIQMYVVQGVHWVKAERDNCDELIQGQHRPCSY